VAGASFLSGASLLLDAKNDSLQWIALTRFGIAARTIITKRPWRLAGLTGFSDAGCAYHDFVGAAHRWP
jgi:hypothetical protein